MHTEAMNSLPNELLLSVFEKLEYVDLKRLRRVCRRYNTLIPCTTRLLSPSPFGKIFFLDAALRTPPEHDNIVIHPIFTAIHFRVKFPYMFASLRDMDYHFHADGKFPIRCDHEKLGDKWTVPDIKALDENAISPAVSSLVLHGYEDCPGTTIGGAGQLQGMEGFDDKVHMTRYVKVLDVLWELWARERWTGDWDPNMWCTVKIEKLKSADGKIHLRGGVMRPWEQHDALKGCHICNENKRH